MKKFTFFVFLLMASSCVAQKTERFSLNTGWSLLNTKTNELYPATIPGSVHTELLQAGIIPDPLVGTNESDIQWVAQQTWTYQSDSFSLNNDGDQVLLRFSGVDTYARIDLNGVTILLADNYFKSYEVDVTHLLQAKNVLQIDFYPPTEAVKEKLSDKSYVLPGEEIRAYARKPQFHYGWDWAPKVLPLGIDHAIEVIIIPQGRITDLYIRQDRVDAESASLLAQAEIEVIKAGLFGINLSFGEIVLDTMLNLSVGRHAVNFPVEIKNPKLWWCREMGDQHRYLAQLDLFSGAQLIDQNISRVGLRTIELVTDQDEGESFYFKVNGKAIFAKGANYIPQDIFQHKVKKRDYDNLLNQVVAANMNMLRVWGGGIYEEDYFYEMCDSLGILVWQDFMFACAMYPGDTGFINNVADEAQQVVKRLRNHACIALWCGNNESSEGWFRWGWQDDLNYFQKKKVWKSYKNLFQGLLPDIVAMHSNTDYWESSPKLGRGDPAHQFEGDAHYWGVWHDAEPFEILNEKVPRFMSEFGFQSFPGMDIWAQLSEDKLSLSSELVLAHEKHPRGLKLIKEYMDRWYGVVPEDFETFIQLSQILQAEGMALGLEAHRRSQPYCMGSLYWQLNDCWPVVSWSSLDSDEKWKAMHYKVRDAFQPLLLTMAKDSQKVHIYAVAENLPHAQLVTFEFELMDMFGEIVDRGTKEVTISPGSNNVYSFSYPELIDKHPMEELILFCRIFKEPLRSVATERAFILETPKNMKLQKAVILLESDLKNGVFELIVSASVFCKNVILTADQAGHFSDNYFDLIPGQNKHISFKPDRGTSTIFSASSLNEILRK